MCIDIYIYIYIFFIYRERERDHLHTREGSTSDGPGYMFLPFPPQRERVTGSLPLKARIAENIIKARVECPCQTPQLMKAAPLEEDGATNPAAEVPFCNMGSCCNRRGCIRDSTQSLARYRIIL